MTRFVVTRHGQSIANAQTRFAGVSDFDLTDIGRAQAELTSKYICENEHIDIIYSSDLLRAYNTAVPTAKRLGMEIIPLTELREIYAGKWEGLTTAEIAKKFPEDYSVWRSDYANCRCTDGEATAEVYERIMRTVADLAKKHDGQTVLLSTHATLVRALCANALGLSAQQTGEIPFNHNASINIFTYEDGKLTAVKTDIIEHLGEIVTGVHKSFNKG